MPINIGECVDMMNWELLLFKTSSMKAMSDKDGKGPDKRHTMLKLNISANLALVFN